MRRRLPLTPVLFLPRTIKLRTNRKVRFLAAFWAQSQVTMLILLTILVLGTDKHSFSAFGIAVYVHLSPATAT